MQAKKGHFELKSLLNKRTILKLNTPNKCVSRVETGRPIKGFCSAAITSNVNPIHTCYIPNQIKSISLLFYYVTAASLHFEDDLFTLGVKSDFPTVAYESTFAIFSSAKPSKGEFRLFFTNKRGLKETRIEPHFVRLLRRGTRLQSWHLI